MCLGLGWAPRYKVMKRSSSNTTFSSSFYVLFPRTVEMRWSCDVFRNSGLGLAPCLDFGAWCFGLGWRPQLICVLFLHGMRWERFQKFRLGWLPWWIFCGRLLDHLQDYFWKNRSGWPPRSKIIEYLKAVLAKTSCFAVQYWCSLWINVFIRCFVNSWIRVGTLLRFWWLAFWIRVATLIVQCRFFHETHQQYFGNLRLGWLPWLILTGGGLLCGVNWGNKNRSG